MLRLLLSAELDGLAASRSDDGARQHGRTVSDLLHCYTMRKGGQQEFSMCFCLRAGRGLLRLL